MGLQSAMTTALTGLQAAETTIDVVGNNVANAGTTGFKESDVLFATQFLQTMSIGSAPSGDRGGTNPRQIGLGVKVAAINPNFNQGTIEISANPLDVAIQGDGFLVVQGPQGNLYTRNGQIQTNNANELVTVTGNRVIGYSVDENFEIVPIEGPLRIPIGESPVSQVTRTAFFQGVLTPESSVGDQPSAIASEVMGDAAYAYPNSATFDSGDFAVVNTPPGTPIGQGNYSYYVTFTDGTINSRPSARIGPITVGPDQRINISNIPQPPSGTSYTGINIYRNLADDSSTFHLLNTSPLALGTTTYTDGATDTVIEANPEIDLIGVKAGNGTLLQNVIVRDGDTYVQPFAELGDLSFEGRRGGRTLGEKTLEITAQSSVQDLISFMEESFGLTNNFDAPADLPEAGGTIGTDGVIRFTSNAGVANALGVTLSSFTLTPPGESTAIPVGVAFTETQAANGEGSTTDFILFDSLGTAVNVRVSTVMEQKTDTSTVYRWFATSDDNQPFGTSVDTFVGTGTIVFDSNGNIESGGIGEINVQRNQSASASPLTVDLDFGQVSGLALTNSQGEDVSSMSMTRQDGFPPGTLSSFIITESGLIRGIFTNGAERPLGQIRMARFTNNVGLQQIGENLFATGVNSGEPIKGNPGDSGIGTLTAGALELSNTDIGQNLIELILASTQYRGGTRVITTAQQLLDELLSLRR